MRTKQEIVEQSDEDTLEDVLLKARFDFSYFAENVVGVTPHEQNPIKMKWFHKEWVEMFLNNRRSCVLASRGFGKTLTLAVLFPLWRSFFHEGEQFLMISPTINDSKEAIGYCRQYIEENEVLRELKPTESNVSWTKTEINTSTRCRIFNKAYSENVRGRQVNWVLCDEAATYEDHDIFFSAVVPTTNRKEGHVMAISTPRAENDLVHKLKKLDAYAYGEYPIKKDGEPIYPEEFDDERIEQIKGEMGERKFRREYLLELVGGDNSVIPLNYIVDSYNYDISLVDSSDSENMYFGADFALSPKGDYTVFLSLEKKDSKYIIRDIQRMRGVNEDMQVQKLEELNSRFGYQTMYLDCSNFGITIVNKARETGLPVQGIPFSSENKKKIYRKVVRAVNNGDLVIPRDKNCSRTMKMSDRLTKELSAVETDRSPSGVNRYRVSAAHDDVIDALGLALMAADKAGKFLPTISMRERGKEWSDDEPKRQRNIKYTEKIGI